jgi:hypothetical protein
MNKKMLRYWTSVLREAERELGAATRRSAINTAGCKLMQAGGLPSLMNGIGGVEGLCCTRLTSSSSAARRPSAVLAAR